MITSSRGGAGSIVCMVYVPGISGKWHPSLQRVQWRRGNTPSNFAAAFWPWWPEATCLLLWAEGDTSCREWPRWSKTWTCLHNATKGPERFGRGKYAIQPPELSCVTQTSSTQFEMDDKDSALVPRAEWWKWWDTQMEEWFWSGNEQIPFFSLLKRHQSLLLKIW